MDEVRGRGGGAKGKRWNGRRGKVLNHYGSKINWRADYFPLLLIGFDCERVPSSLFLRNVNLNYNKLEILCNV